MTRRRNEIKTIFKLFIIDVDVKKELIVSLESCCACKFQKELIIPPLFLEKTPCDTVSYELAFFQQPLTQKFAFFTRVIFRFSWFMQNIIIDSFYNDVSCAYDGSGRNTLIHQAHKQNSTLVPAININLSSKLFHSLCELLTRQELKTKRNRRKIAKRLRNNFLRIRFVDFSR